MKFINVYDSPIAPAFLFNLLGERTKEQSISHKKMPSLSEHMAFFNSKPYFRWYLIEVDNEFVGSVYLTKSREVGLFILKEFHGRGFGKSAVQKLREWHPGKILANINPGNDISRRMFEGMGATLIQVTYELN